MSDVVVVVVSVGTLRHFAACAPVVTLLLIELPPLSLSPLCTQSATNCASESSGNPVCTGFKYKHEDEELCTCGEKIDDCRDAYAHITGGA